MKCFYCGEEIESGNGSVIALDVPYVNLFVHRRECFPKIEDYGIMKYLQENRERIDAYIEEPTKDKKAIKRGM